MAGEGTSARESERLARRYFELVRVGDTESLLELLHSDVVISLKSRGGEMLRGREMVARYLADVADSRSLVQTTAERFRVVDDERVIVEGRLRWMDEHRVFRDDPVVWALEFRDGRLLRSLPVRSVGEAEAILGAGGAEAGEAGA